MKYNPLLKILQYTRITALISNKRETKEFYVFFLWKTIFKAVKELPKYLSMVIFDRKLYTNCDLG